MKLMKIKCRSIKMFRKINLPNRVFDTCMNLQGLESALNFTHTNNQLGTTNARLKEFKTRLEIA